MSGAERDARISVTCAGVVMCFRRGVKALRAKV